MKRISLAFCSLLVLFPATQASADEMAKALDFLGQQGRPWAEIQGQPCDRAALRELTSLVGNVSVDQVRVHALARQWDRLYGYDREDAIQWCDAQMYRTSTVGDWRQNDLWIQRKFQIEGESFRYSDNDSSGVHPDQMRAWAYFARFYGVESPALPPPFHEQSDWGRIKANYR
jgi:hypothetical protein